MKFIRSPLVKVPTKAPTGIAGFDEMPPAAAPRCWWAERTPRQDHIRAVIPEAWRAGLQGAGNFLALGETSMDELRRRRDATSGQKIRILYPKHEVNELLVQAGQMPR